MGLLDGKVAVVTGAGGGLGETHALLLAKEGASVVVNDLGGARDGSGAGSAMADLVVDKIKEAGGKAVADYGNVASEEDAKAMIQKAVDEFGKIDFLIANAGILRDKSFKNMTDDMWDIVLNVHLPWKVTADTERLAILAELLSTYCTNSNQYICIGGIFFNG